MSLAPFAALEARVCDAVQRRLANATAVYQGGAPFGVLFDRTASDPYGQAVDVAALTVGYCVVNTPGVREGSELTIDGVVHKITGPVQPDAGGWIQLSVYPKD
ncbi:head-tail joining protein [Acidovorax sp. BL-A-41-H1]|uniref:head-tail joining protein n=1 Tax=Acidovorax sp. BL-A-41-H1 TaxID=3421102 RepID=UPI003F79ED9E